MCTLNPSGVASEEVAEKPPGEDGDSEDGDGGRRMDAAIEGWVALPEKFKPDEKDHYEEHTESKGVGLPCRCQVAMHQGMGHALGAATGTVGARKHLPDASRHP